MEHAAQNSSSAGVYIYFPGNLKQKNETPFYFVHMKIQFDEQEYRQVLYFFCYIRKLAQNWTANIKGSDLSV